jgi:hypothetical protein
MLAVIGGGDGKGGYGNPVRETNGKGDVELSEKDNMRKDCGVLKENTMREAEERCWNGGYMLTRSEPSGGNPWGGTDGMERMKVWKWENRRELGNHMEPVTNGVEEGKGEGREEKTMCDRTERKRGLSVAPNCAYA